MNRLLKCIKTKDSSYTPIWFMRQAGRYLPEFQEIRKKNKNFLKLCFNTNLASTISLQPLHRFNLDAVIIFSDILTVPYSLGQKVKFIKNKGPVLEKLDIDLLLKIKDEDFTRKLSPVYKSIKEVKKKIPQQKALISFVGSPWTLLVYMINLQSPKKKIDVNKIFKDTFRTNIILEKLNHFVCLHAFNQIKAGSDLVQIFDSWAGLLPKNKLTNFCYIPNLKIVDYLKSKKITSICFPKGLKKNLIDFNTYVGPDCLSIDYDTDPVWARKNLNNVPIQGGLNPNLLLKENAILEKSLTKYLNTFKGYPYIFNLGHGVLPNTNPDKISFIIDKIKNF